MIVLGHEVRPSTEIWIASNQERGIERVTNVPSLYENNPGWTITFIMGCRYKLDSKGRL